MFLWLFEDIVNPLCCRWVSIRSLCAAIERKSQNRRSFSSWTVTLWTTVTPSQVRRHNFTRFHKVCTHREMLTACCFTSCRLRLGWWQGFLQRSEGRRHCDVCQWRWAGPHPVGPGHVSCHWPVPQACPTHSGPETQLQRGCLSPNGCSHFSVL